MCTAVIFITIFFLITVAIFQPKKEKIIKLIRENEGVNLPLPAGYRVPSAEYLGKYIDPSKVMYYREIFKSKYSFSWWLIVGVLTPLAFIGFIIFFGAALGLGTSLLEYLQSIESITFDLAPLAVATRRPTVGSQTIKHPTATHPQTQSTASIMAASGCKEWNSLLPSDDGKMLCVYGVITTTGEKSYIPYTPGEGKCRKIQGEDGPDMVCKETTPITGTPMTVAYWLFKSNKYIPNYPYLWGPFTKSYRVSSCIWVKGIVVFDAEGVPTIYGNYTYNLCSSPP